MLAKGDAGMDSVPVNTRLHFRRVYFSRCAAADAMIGQVLTAFEKHGDVDNTYTMFIAEYVGPNFASAHKGVVMRLYALLRPIYYCLFCATMQPW